VFEHKGGGVMELKRQIGYKAWIKSYSNKGTRAVLKLGYNAFIKFLEQKTSQKWNDEKLIRERTEDLDKRSYVFEQNLIEFYNWLRDQDITYEKFRTKQRQKISDSTRKAYLKGIRSFFAFHRLDFKLTNQQKLKLSKKPRPAIRYYDFSLDDITKMSKFANPKERYILLCGKDLGLRANDFVNLKQGLFSAHLKEKEEPYSLGETYTEKEGVTANPFLTNEGKMAVETWLKVLESKGLRNDSEPMLSIKKAELSENLKRLAKKSGIETGNEKVRFHSLRKFLIDRLSSTTSESKWKQIVGKQVSERAYVSELQLREIYARVLPLIRTRQLTENNHAKLGLLEDTVKQLEKENRVFKARIELLQDQNATQQKQIEELRKTSDEREMVIIYLKQKFPELNK
jgi:integrase